jgi:hypothetical protein
MQKPPKAPKAAPKLGASKRAWEEALAELCRRKAAEAKAG